MQGRAITARVIGPDSSSRKLLLIECIHGNEFAGHPIVSAVGRLRPGRGVQLWLVQQCNPDGTAADIRQNAHGVDLNRNFPVQWQRVSDPTYYSGPHPASEPETHVAMRLIDRIKPAVTIRYHQHEDLVDMPGGDRGVPRRYAQISGLRATCLPFLPAGVLPVRAAGGLHPRRGASGGPPPARRPGRLQHRPGAHRRRDRSAGRSLA